MDKRYVFDLDASGQHRTIEEARTKLEALAEHARSIGLNVSGGSIRLCRETEPVEGWALGSDKPFRNLTSEEGTPQATRFERVMTPA